MRSKKLTPIHPGEHLADILKEAGITANALALRLARYFGTSPEFWMNLQTKYDLDTAQDAIADQIAREVMPQSAA
jgi:plasmid maintenance system antidote protein VapI